MIKRRNSSVIHAACLLIPITHPVLAAEWTAEAGVAPAITYTDNVCLSHDDEQGEWIALVTPDVSINGNGRRANLNLTASVEMNSLSDSKIEELGCNPAGVGNRKQFAPRLNANADAILVEGWLNLDAKASVHQSEITPFAAGGGDSLNRTGNTNTITYYTVSPYVARRFKDAAELLLRYTWDEQFNSEDAVRDSTEESVLFTLGSNPATTALFWGLQADYSNVKYGGGGALDVRDAPDSELASAQLNLGYQFNRYWQINGFYGEEYNDFTSSADEIDGKMWDVGIRWTPNSRTVVEAGTGDRFFGATPRFSISHEYKHSVFNASYARDLTYARDIRTLGDTTIPGSDQTTLSTSPILDERFTLGYAYNWRRSTLKLDASHSDQTQTRAGRNSTFKRFSVSLNRSLSSQLSVNSSLSWDEQQPLGEQSDLIGITGDSETWRFQLGIQRSFNSNTDLSLDYLFTDRQSDRVEGEYTESRSTCTIRVRVEGFFLWRLLRVVGTFSAW